MSKQIESLLQQNGLEPKLIQEIVDFGRSRKIDSGQVLISHESSGNEIPFLMNGLLKVLRQNPDGEEVFLYYLEAGETCAMSLSCCIEGKNTPIKVIAEEDSSLWMIPQSYMDNWVAKYPSFRSFVFGSYQTRFDELLSTIDSVVFHNLDERLYRFLLDTKQATGSFEIHKTHEQIANELNTSRVVVSRLLKKLEKEEKIEQHRNMIEIL